MATVLCEHFIGTTCGIRFYLAIEVEHEGVKLDTTMVSSSSSEFSSSPSSIPLLKLPLVDILTSSSSQPEPNKTALNVPSLVNSKSTNF